MAGKPFKVGRFAHTLRVRLMREHAGVDVDALEEDDLMAHSPTQPAHEQEPWDPEKEQEGGKEDGVTRVGHQERRTAAKSLFSTGANALREGARSAFPRRLYT
jgi:phospholipase D1/2